MTQLTPTLAAVARAGRAGQSASRPGRRKGQVEEGPHGANGVRARARSRRSQNRKPHAHRAEGAPIVCALLFLS